MKRIFTLCVALCTLIPVFSQTDTTGKQNIPPTEDTIKIGGMIIIRKREVRMMVRIIKNIRLLSAAVPSSQTLKQTGGSLILDFLITQIIQIMLVQPHKLMLPEVMKPGLI